MTEKALYRLGSAVALMCAAAAAPETQPAAAPPPDANLIVYRDHAEPTVWSPTVKIDGRKIAALPNRHFTAAVVPPGPHKVTLSWPLLSGQSGGSMDVTVIAGQRHYVEVTGISRVAGFGYQTTYFNMGSGIAEVRPEHAEAAIAACCKFKAGK